MDELAELVKRIKETPIEGSRAFDEKPISVRGEAERTIFAVRDVTRMLADGEWHRKKLISYICEHYGVGFDTICQLCLVAESDDGHWVCIDNGIIDEVAPDEKRRKIVERL